MTKKRKKPSGDEILETYTTEITYVCPKRGKVTQKVKVKKYKSAEMSYLKEVRIDDILDENTEEQASEE